jgi:hypothetical protein
MPSLLKAGKMLVAHVAVSLLKDGNQKPERLLRDPLCLVLLPLVCCCLPISIFKMLLLFMHACPDGRMGCLMMDPK